MASCENTNIPRISDAVELDISHPSDVGAGTVESLNETSHQRSTSGISFNLLEVSCSSIAPEKTGNGFKQNTSANEEDSPSKPIHFNINTHPSHSLNGSGSVHELSYSNEQYHDRKKEITASVAMPSHSTSLENLTDAKSTIASTPTISEEISSKEDDTAILLVQKLKRKYAVGQYIDIDRASKIFKCRILASDIESASAEGILRQPMPLLRRLLGGHRDAWLDGHVDTTLSVDWYLLVKYPVRSIDDEWLSVFSDPIQLPLRPKVRLVNAKKSKSIKSKVNNKAQPGEEQRPPTENPKQKHHPEKKDIHSTPLATEAPISTDKIKKKKRIQKQTFESLFGTHFDLFSLDNDVPTIVRRSGRINLREAYKAPIKKKKKGKKKVALDEQSQGMISDMNAVLCQLDNQLSQELVAMESDHEDRPWYENYTCDKCKQAISLWRCYCRYCISPNDWHQSFDLCLSCFLYQFERARHSHPRESFSLMLVLAPSEIFREKTYRASKRRVIREKKRIREQIKQLSRDDDPAEDAPSRHVIDDEETAWLENEDEIDRFSVVQDFLGTQEPLLPNALSLSASTSRRFCALCLESTIHEYGPLLGPFLARNAEGEPQEGSGCYVHEACARYSPEVCCENPNIVQHDRDVPAKIDAQHKDTVWYNIIEAVKRGRGIKCARCPQKGATVGCHDPRCQRSYHLRCSGKPLAFFEIGAIYWCPLHERGRAPPSMRYDDVVTCDHCQLQLEDSWWSCRPCRNYFASYDLCVRCYEQQQQPSEGVHAHALSEFEQVTEQAYRAQFGALGDEEEELRSDDTARLKTPTVCFFCRATASSQWRQGYRGHWMCYRCVTEEDDKVESAPQTPPRRIEPTLSASFSSPPLSTCTGADVSYQKYLTRHQINTLLQVTSSSPSAALLSSPSSTAAVAAQQPQDASAPSYLKSYGPARHQLDSVVFSSTYYDLPGHAARWANHTHADYPGTWLAQNARWAMLRYTRPGDRVLSSFLGRGTDVIEASLMGRHSVGIDINPQALALAQRNCSFAVPARVSRTWLPIDRYRPQLVLGDARRWTVEEQFDLVLSHPPYHHAITYSAGIEGDLSRMGTLEEFGDNMVCVAQASLRALRANKRCVVCVGDNREHCYLMPVCFVTFRAYLRAGFILEEFVARRQRFCSGAAKGAFLSLLYDFFTLTHEFLAVFRKPAEGEQRETRLDQPLEALVLKGEQQILGLERRQRVLPEAEAFQASRVLGTVWTFDETPSMRLEDYVMAQLIERFAKPGDVWEEIVFTKGNLRKEREEGREKEEQEEEEEKETDAESGTESGSLTDSETFSDSEVVSDPLNAMAVNESIKSSAYEEDRIKRIKNNDQVLHSMGLAMSNKPTVMDQQRKLVQTELCAFYADIMAVPWRASRTDTPLKMIFVPHFDEFPLGEKTTENMIAYRQALRALAVDAAKRLSVGGYLVMGVKDVRDVRGMYWPLGMLLQEDMMALRASLIMKEMVVLAGQQYVKARPLRKDQWPVNEVDSDDENDPFFKEERDMYIGDAPGIGDLALPIVHQYYFGFIKHADL